MLSPGDRLGPYEVVSPLGAGGMGEVYRARDTRLAREVAIKVLPEAVASNPERLKRFEREARAVASLNHPHVLTLYDVGTHAGVPYVVTELLEGETLRELLVRRSPTARQVLSLGVQIAEGLAAAHGKGIVHRDLKPENLFLTTDGRAKVLDFGLARLSSSAVEADSHEATESSPTKPGVLLGTLGYMSPEQVRAQGVDHRSDLFSLGVVLFELLTGEHPFRRETTAATLGAILSEEPTGLGASSRGIPPGTEAVVLRCLAKRREDRFQSAQDLAFALEAVRRGASGRGEGASADAGRLTGGVGLGGVTRGTGLEGVEERSPYPGLLSFTEKEAGQFFGREGEVEALWERLGKRRLLAVIGPSGAGKTSFVRAGVVASRPEGWAAIVCTPGPNPALALARALTPELAGDTEAHADLLQGVTDFVQGGQSERIVSVVRRWRRLHDEALVVVDQFEELFTLCPEETQARFARLLAALTADADLHVLLSLRDDFLMRCSAHEPLVPVFTELTPLGALTPQGLERALLEPARQHGYRFEDDALVPEMLEGVAGARSALPLLAFAVARLWEERDRERKLLTREAYRRVGGVEGALAQHAEATLDRIGPAREGVVREIFRNLTTAQGTRAVLEREELLSTFPVRSEAEQVLGQLVDARLLTAYEATRSADPSGPGGEEPLGMTGERVEIVHESLLKAWPRLVRWQTQDEEGALLRDQLRQAARLWDDRRRPEDLLWTGASYLDYRAWRARYAGGLSSLEEDFAKAMTALAERRRRRRRAAAAVVLAGALALAVGTSLLWLRAEHARAEARAEALRREAAQILALGRLRLEDDPSAAFAHALASLEKADSEAGRRFAVEALWRGPIGRWLPGAVVTVGWSPDGRWLATSGIDVSLFDAATGARRQLSSEAEAVDWFSSDGETLTTFKAPGAEGPTERIRSTSSGELLRSTRFPPRTHTLRLSDGAVLALTFDAPWQAAHMAEIRVRGPDEGEPRAIGRWSLDRLSGYALDVTERWLASAQGGRILVQSLDRLDAPPRELGRLVHPLSCCGGAWKDRFVTGETSGDLRVWSVAEGHAVRTLRNPAGTDWTVLGPGGRLLAAGPAGALPARGLLLFDLDSPPDAEPIPLLSRRIDSLGFLAFDPAGRWLASAHSDGGGVLWPVATPRSVVLRGLRPPYIGVAFTPDGKHLVSTSAEGAVRLWSLTATGGGVRTLWRRDGLGDLVLTSPAGRFVVVPAGGSIVILPLDGGPVRIVGAGASWSSISLDPSGRWAAVGKPGGVHLVDLTSGRLRPFPPVGELRDCMEGVYGAKGLALPFFLPDGRLISYGFDDLRLWNLEDGSNRVLRRCEKGPVAVPVAATPDSRQVLLQLNPVTTATPTWPTVVDTETGVTRRITSHGSRFPPTNRSMTLDPTGRVLVTGDQDGLVRVGPLSGEEPHLLFGHTRQVTSVAVSPDGKWIASASDDGTIRLWPMPDVTKPPLHTLPYGELLEKLRAFTNLRVVPDAGSASGYKLEAGPFPGWKEVPIW